MTGKGYQKRLKGDENLEGSYDRDVDCVFFFFPPLHISSTAFKSDVS